MTALPELGGSPTETTAGPDLRLPPSKHTPASLGQKVWNEHHRYCLLRSKWFRGGTWVETKEKKGAVYLCNCKLVSTQRKSIRPSLPAVLLCCCLFFCSGIIAETVWMSTYVKKNKNKKVIFTVIYERFRFQNESLDLHETVGQSVKIIKIRELNNNLESD